MRVVAAVWLASALTLGAASAHAAEKEACAAAATAAQQLRDQGKLLRAREQLLACTRPTCPAIVKEFCDRWLLDLDASLPSVVFRAQDAAGNDLVAVRVAVDGATIAERLEGKPVPVDPGPHVLRFEYAEYPTVEQRVVIRQGETNRAIAVRFEPSAALAPTALSEPPQRSPVAQLSTLTEPHRPVAAYALAGLGTVALGVFVALDVVGQRDYSRCKDAPVCTQSNADALAVKRDMALVAAGVSVLSFGAGAWLFFGSRPSAVRGSVGFGVRLVAAGQLGAIYGVF
jgi:hypothetical protein